MGKKKRKHVEVVTPQRTFRPSHHPLSYVIFATPVGEFERIGDAIQACRDAKIKLGKRKSSPISTQITDRPTRR